MAKLGINTGTSPNSSTGDTLLDGAIKINSNFNEIYTALGTGTTINLTTDKVTEGTNLYFTNEKAQDAIGSAISAGIQTGISVVYNDASNSINFNVGISTDSEKLSGQDPCFYLNYDNFYNYPEKNWVNIKIIII